MLQLTLKIDRHRRPTAVRIFPTSNSLRFILPDPAPRLNESVWPTGDGLLPRVTAATDDTGVALSLPWPYALPHEVKERAYGFDIIVRKLFVRSASRSLAPGVVLVEEETGLPEGRQRTIVVRASAGSARLELLNRRGPALEATSALASRHRPLVAVNGGYFSPRDGFALGLVQAGDRILSGPFHARTALHLSQEQPSLARAGVHPWILLPGGESAEVDQVNVLPAAADGLSLFREPWPARSGSRGDDQSLELAMSPDGVVLGMGPRDLGLPPGGWLLHARGARAVWLADRVRRGNKIQLHDPTTEFWGRSGDALGGGPELVQDGQVRIGTDERFRSDITRGRHARTAVGLSRDGGLILLVTAQDRPGDLGMSLEETARALLRHGAWQGVNMDGGTSSTFWTAGSVLVGQRPDRPVANALGLYASGHREEVQDPRDELGADP